ncbi:MAG: zinc ribbon domain-containing protein, partial [Candidatus Methanomethylicaceae archaeon]
LQRIRQRCEEEGIRLEFKSPYKTSQRCPLCGNIDRKNRRADRFICTCCGFEEHADIVGAMNLKALGLAGAYSLRSLQTRFSETGINVY